MMDLPGIGDAEGDQVRQDKVKRRLEEWKTVNAFLLVVNSANPRFDKVMESTLIFYSNMYGTEFLKNAMLVFTRWGYDKSSIR